MDTDLALITGLAAGALAVPAMLTSISEGRPPRVSLLVLLIAIVLIGGALAMKPGGYRLNEVPGVFFSVAGRLF
jgi:hypothetical protein